MKHYHHRTYTVISVMRALMKPSYILVVLVSFLSFWLILRPPDGEVMWRIFGAASFPNMIFSLALGEIARSHNEILGEGDLNPSLRLLPIGISLIFLLTIIVGNALTDFATTNYVAFLAVYLLTLSFSYCYLCREDMKN